MKGLGMPMWTAGWRAWWAGQTSGWLWGALTERPVVAVRFCGTSILNRFCFEDAEVNYLKTHTHTHFKLSLAWLVLLSKNLKPFFIMWTQKLNIKRWLIWNVRKEKSSWKKLKAELDIIFMSEIEGFLVLSHSEKGFIASFLSSILHL